MNQTLYTRIQATGPAWEEVKAMTDDEILAVFTERLNVALASSDIDPALALLASTFAGKWYVDAHTFAVGLARLAEISLEQAAGLIAATSIRTKWDKNLVNAVRAADGQLTDGLRIIRTKCDEILGLNANTATLDDVKAILRGPKISAFCENIYDPFSRVATIDVWMCRLLDIPHSAAKGRIYDIAQRAIQTVADSRNQPVPALQAEAWVLIRGKAD